MFEGISTASGANGLPPQYPIPFPADPLFVLVGCVALLALGLAILATAREFTGHIEKRAPRPKVSIQDPTVDPVRMSPNLTLSPRQTQRHFPEDGEKHPDE